MQVLSAFITGEEAGGKKKVHEAQEKNKLYVSWYNTLLREIKAMMGVLEQGAIGHFTLVD